MPRSLFVLRGAVIQTIAVVSIAAALAAGSLVAGAQGTAVIQQADGAVNTYPGVKIQIVQRTLTVTTPDGKGTLIIDRAACSYQSEVMICLPNGATLIQGGSVKGIKLASGTVYLNLTDDKQQLAMSTTQLPPHSILLSLKTIIGTYINVSGQIDKVAK